MTVQMIVHEHSGSLRAQKMGIMMSTASNLKTQQSNAGGSRKRTVGAVLALSLLAPSWAWAQCTDNFNFFAVNVPVPGHIAPISNLLPLGTGSSLSALTSTINSVNTAFLTTTSAFVSAPGNPQPDQQGSGVWARTVAGTVENNSTSTGTLTVPPATVGAPATGSQTCNSTIRQDYVGYQFGHDISVLNAGGTGANLHFGVTAGYFEARTRDVTSAGSFFNPTLGLNFTTPPGTFADTSQVPFVGLYTAYTKGNFFADGQVRWDFYENILSDANNGISRESLNAFGFSATANAGYHVPLRNNWFVEPSGGVIWSHVNVNPINVPGQLQQAFPFSPFAQGTVAVDDIDSVLGRLSISVGTSFTNGPVTWQPYFTASIFHEFAGDVTATSTVNQPGTNFDGFALHMTEKDGVGTYGQFALGSAAVLGNTGWLGYGRVDYRIGDHIEGWSVNAGLRYQFSPESRGSIKDGPAPVVYAYNWTGPYIGAFAGATWGSEDWSTPFPGGATTHDHPDFMGYVAGGQVGYNWQTGRVVLGVEGDYGFTNAEGGRSCDNAGGLVTGTFNFTCEAEVQRLASVTGRVGYTWGRALVYAKGGVAFGEVTAQTSQNSGLAVPPSGNPINGTTHWLTGWTVGGGMEFALTDRWSARAEYMHYDLGRDHFPVDSGLTADASTSGDTVRVGVNLHLHSVERELPLK